MKTLFDQEPNWKDEWQGMIEFVQSNKKPSQKIVVNFESFDDVLKFAELLGFKPTKKTKSIWFPIKPKDNPRAYAYVDSNK